MGTVGKLVKFQIQDQVRNRWIIFYMMFFAILTIGLYRLEGETSRVLVSLINLELIIVPLFCLIFGTIYIYNSRQFIEMLLSQPVERSSIFWGMIWGLFIPLSTGFVAGVGIPALIYGDWEWSQILLLSMILATGILLTAVCIGLAYMIALRSDDRLKGLAMAIGTWFFLSLMFDSILLMIVFAFGDYPLERVLIGLSFLNPINVARTILLLKLDISALMGYTGAVFHKFFGGSWGMVSAWVALTFWVIGPTWVGQRIFSKKDF